MTDANTPRTAYTDEERETGQRFLAVMDGSTGNGINLGRAIRAAIEAAAAAPTPAEPLDVERLRSDLKAEFIHNGSYNRTAVWMGFDRVLDRLAAARPEADHD